MTKKRKSENEAPEKENADIKQDDLIQQIVDELPIIRTKNYIANLKIGTVFGLSRTL